MAPVALGAAGAIHLAGPARQRGRNLSYNANPRHNRGCKKPAGKKLHVLCSTVFQALFKMGKLAVSGVASGPQQAGKTHGARRCFQRCLASATPRVMFAKILRMLAKLVLGFFALSLVLAVGLRFVPVTVTATMLMDPNGFAKDWESLSNIDRNLVSAVIAAEDSKFCTHNGFDTEAIEQAIEERLSGERERGASTISQQTAKNVFLWQGGGFFRKGLEAYFTFLIEHVWSKRRIMEVYLNVAETGIGTYGAEAGAQRYFDHSAARLSPGEASRMAAVLPSPKRRAVINPGGFTRRYGNTIRARIGVVRRDGLDGCVYD